MDNSLRCLNCSKHVAEKDARIFAEVYVCSPCSDMAERLYHRCEGELRRMLLLLRESIRVALVEGRLHYGAAESSQDISKEELLKMIVQLSEKKK
jgi:hypothetical protein